MATRSNTLTLEPNVPCDIVLKYQTGRVIESTGNVMFTLMDGRALFVKPEVARKIHELGLAQNEPLRIMKRVVGRETSYIVSRVGGQPLHTATPAATTRDEEEDHPQPLPQHNTQSQKLAGCYVAAIDALEQAQQYAKTHNVPINITAEEVRCSAHVLFIELGKAEERAMRQREFDARYGWKEPQKVNGGATWQQQ